MRRALSCCSALVVAVALAGPPTATPTPTPAATAATGVQVLLPSGTTLEAEVMVTPEERARGLMFRSDAEFPAGRAMVFFFDTPQLLSFWMKNVNFAIDIVWLSEDGRIVHLEREVPPCAKEPCPHYAPMQKAQTVVELHRGTIAGERLKLGDTIRVLGPGGETLGPS